MWSPCLTSAQRKKNSPNRLTDMDWDDKIPPLKKHYSKLNTGPHRLVDQDAALSRLKPEFESPWGHSQNADKAFLI